MGEAGVAANAMTTREKIEQLGIVPVLRARSAEEGRALVDALVAGGIVAGVLAALVFGRLINSFLFGVKSLDVWTYLAVMLMLVLVGGLAAFIPARRAAAVEPIQALREE